MPVQNFGSLSQKILGTKNMQNLTRFGTNSKFDCEYPRNGWRYSKSNKYTFNRGFFRVRRKIGWTSVY